MKVDEDKKQNDEMSWTNQELETWIKEGLIPRNLLGPSMQMELCHFLLMNKEKLRVSHRGNAEETKCVITLPPIEEIDTTHELRVVEEGTRIVLHILDKITNIELCDGVVLAIKAKELLEWQKETACAQELTKGQSKELKLLIDSVGKERPLTRKEIITFIEEIRKPRRVPKYRQSGHLVDQKLKYAKQNREAELFDVILPETKRKIEESTIEIKAEGIKLTPPENKLVHALNRILFEKSQTQNSKAEDFYGGNAPSQLVPYGQQEQKSVTLRFKPAELYKAYMGKEAYSGADVAFINETVHQLESKKVLIRYDRIKKTKNGKKEETLTDRIEDFQSLIKILKFFPDLTDEEKERLNNGEQSIREERGEIVIALNPIFTDQIDTKFIEFPIDTNRRLVIAAGGHNKVTASMQMLMEWMLRELSAGRNTMEINEENLPYAIGLEKYVKQNRKNRLKERIEKDIHAMIGMGIVLYVERKPNSIGGTKMVFHLNKEYE